MHSKLVETVFVKTQDNEADILTKNTTKAEFEKHVQKLVVSIPKELLANLENVTAENEEDDQNISIVEDTPTEIIKN